MKSGKTPVLDSAEWRRLLDAIPTESVRDLRDRAHIATLIYSLARIGAALASGGDGVGGHRPFVAAKQNLAASQAA